MWEYWHTQAVPVKTHKGEITMNGRKVDSSIMQMTCPLIQNYDPQINVIKKSQKA